MVDGQHHTVSPRYLHQYATHAAWMEDNRISTKARWQTARLASAAKLAGLERLLAAQRGQ
jgi:hypothetical protein